MTVLPAWTALVTVVLVAEYYSFARLVALARRRTGIKAPAMVGDPALERTIRVHLNTLEKLAVVMPTLWIAAGTVGDLPAAAIGGAWGATRIVYAIGYLRSPRGRWAGAILGDACEILLVVLAGYGAFHALAGARGLA
jgi:hypothetical protein